MDHSHELITGSLTTHHLKTFSLKHQWWVSMQLNCCIKLLFSNEFLNTSRNLSQKKSSSRLVLEHQNMWHGNSSAMNTVMLMNCSVVVEQILSLCKSLTKSAGKFRPTLAMPSICSKREIMCRSVTDRYHNWCNCLFRLPRRFFASAKSIFNAVILSADSLNNRKIWKKN